MLTKKANDIKCYIQEYCNTWSLYNTLTTRLAQIKDIYQYLQLHGQPDVRLLEMSRHIPGDILENIISELEYDKNSLFACLLVNRQWCRYTVKVLWAKPFHLSYSRKLLCAYIPFFPPDSCANIGIENTARTTCPLFDYPSFIREISVYYMCCGIRSYILDGQFVGNEKTSNRRPYTDF
ncbi:6845_t:CDS:1, partial [Acaulospora morrowiae]